FAMLGSWVLIPMFVQMPSGLSLADARLVDYGFGASATRAGLYLVPGAVVGFASGAAAGVLGRRWGTKVPLALGMFLGALGASMLAMWHAEPWQVVIGL